MKNYGLPIFNCWFLLFLLYWQPISITAQTGEEPEFNYIEGSPKGPEHWGELKSEWKLCKIGQRQSPIDILNKDVQVNINPRDLRFNYKASNAIIKNTGPYVEVEWVGDAGSIQINGKQYSLRQCHWHSPAEHLINGKRYDLELHMVHVNTSNQVSVVRAQFYQIGEPDSFLSKFTEELKTLVNNRGKRSIGIIDPRETNTDTFKYYRYNGSLTTPPCDEGVTWIVNAKINTVSSKQVQLLREANFDYRGKDNARPVQALNDRKIFLYGARPW
ncbi:alpha carbonic anhydrase 7-like isoform X2 [Quercus robur]|uniref:alpha carbonic anhydrase 7-like isoform X2 n=1 Tax=Quercus robur TaxID=38942 RepID=UPI0021629750|nr:alpha carbonic anhydrase 7-like isoform X2 [Quercus robur]